MKAVFGGATPDDAVLIQVTEGGKTQTYPYIFPLPAWEGVEETYHPVDFALCDALCFMDAQWEPGYVPLGRVISRLHP